MATKNYLSLERLKEYDALIKAKIASDDAAALEAANKHTDEEIAKLTNTETGILAQAKAEDAKVQQSVDNLSEYVGTIPEGATATNVVAYVQEKTAGIATEGAMNELDGRVEAVEGKVTTLIGEDANKSVRTIANEELAKQLIAEGAADALNSLEEIAAWIQSHPGDASAMNQAIIALQNKTVLGTDADSKEYATVKAYVEAVMGAEVARVDGLLEDKVDKVDGKGLSTNDLTDALKGNYDAAYEHSQVAHAPADAQANIIESVKVNGTALTITGKAVDITVPVDNAELTNGAGYLVASDIANKADKATTLAGYGIGDAYTKAEVDGAIEAAKTDASNKDAVVLAEAQKGIAAMDVRMIAVETWQNDFVEVSEEDIQNLFA